MSWHRNRCTDGWTRIGDSIIVDLDDKYVLCKIGFYPNGKVAEYSEDLSDAFVYDYTHPSVMSVDIETHFNRTRHCVIYDSLCLYYPSLLPFFRFKHEQPNSAGDIVAYTRTGVGQGDPWCETIQHPTYLQ